MPSIMQLIMRSGPTPGMIYELVGDLITIGRDPSNDIAINNAEPSRRHARLTYQGGKYVIEDLGSTNGTFVNGQRLSGPRSLRPGEVISIGEQIVFVYDEIQINFSSNPSNEQINQFIRPTKSGGQKAYLVMRTGPTPGASFELNGTQITLGRDSTNDITVNDAEISRRHARFTSQGDTYGIEDLGSTNGTFINGERVNGPRTLKPGNIISFGEQITFVYENRLNENQWDKKSSQKNIVPTPIHHSKEVDNQALEKTIQVKTEQRVNLLPFIRKTKDTKVDDSAPKSPHQHKVFISYSRKDLDFVKKLAQDLAVFGTDPWWDLSRIRGGDTWIRSIQSALDNSHSCIVVMTPDSIQSQWVEREYTYAFNNNIKVIPIYLKTVEKIPFSFSTIHYIDFRYNPYSIALKELQVALEAYK